MNWLATKQFRDARRGRVNGRAEHAQHLRLRTNLERTLYSRVQTLIRKLGNTQAFLYREFGIFEPQAAARNMTEELFPVINAHYRRTFVAVFELNNSHYERKQEVQLFGRSVDIERLVAEFFATRQLFLSNISINLANRIDKMIQQGRLDDLTLPQIAKKISDTFAAVSASRAVEMNEPFILAHPKLGTVQMQHVGDPAGGAYHSVNCRCVIVYADERDVVT